MQIVLFWIFASLMLLFAALVVTLRNPVSCALSLVMTFLALAALFVTLDAFFIGIIQVLVYTGAVMVLFLFIIMLLDLRKEKVRPFNLAAWAGGGLVSVGFLGLIIRVIHTLPGFAFEKPPLSNPGTNDIEAVGWTLFRFFNLPFQIIGVLLLVATVGVVLLSKKEIK